MLAAICSEPGRIEMKEVPKPTPQAGQVLVKIAACGVCRSDVSGYLGKHPMIGYPIILGHECSGTIADVGAGASPDLVGASVAVETFFRLCGRCRGCESGAYNLCRAPQIIGHNAPGAFAEYMLANASFVFPLPDGVSLEQAALTEPLSVAVHAVKRCGVSFSDTVAVLGVGAIGLLIVQVAKAAGARVIAIDVNEQKLSLAQRFGAEETIDASVQDVTAIVRSCTRGEGADVVIEAVGRPDTLWQMVDLGRAGGTLMPIGFTGNVLDEINLGRITLSEMTLLGILGFCRDFPTSLGLLASGSVDVRPLLTHQFPLSQVEQAILTMKEAKELVLRALVRPDRAAPPS
ncbi:MAG: zinc-binding dehydrogenase [Armatimonadota bacterium]|jgi:L-iditol 2-dehydrogenase